MQTVVISGANRGLGLEFASQYAGDGARVFAGARNPGAALELNEAAQAANGRLTVLRLDVVDPASVASFAKAVGKTPIDILIANAGVFGGDRQHHLGRIDFDEFADTFAINAAGALRLADAFVGNLKAAKGKFIGVTSGMGSIAEDGSGYLGYRASKAALNMIMRTLAHDLAGTGVLCLPMSPGWARTDMGGPDAPQDPGETVRAMRALIARLQPSDSGRFLNWKGEERPW